MNNSPAKGSNFFHSDFTDNFANKYLSEHAFDRPRPELIKQQLQAETQSLNSTLGSLFPDRPRLGLPFSNDPREVQKTLQVIKMLLTQRQRDIESKNQIYSNIRKIEGERNQLGAQLEKIQKQLKKIDTERQNLFNKLKATQKNTRETVDRLTTEKDQLNKRYRGIEARQNQYKNQIRKQEATVKSLQEKLAKGQEKGGFRNSFQVMQQLQTYGPTFVVVNGQHQYNQMVARTMEENYTDIVNENQFYKDTLQNIQKELQTVLELKKDLLRRRRGYDSQLDTALQLSPFPSQLLNLPPNFSRQGINQLQQNVGRFKQAMKTSQLADERDADQKVSCVSNVKNLIRNYKNVVQSQQQLLNRVILKAKQFKSNEMLAIESRHAKAMDEDQIQRARRFLEEQSSYLESKNKQLQLTRKAMQSTIRKVEHQKQQFVKRSTQVNDDLHKIKKQVQLLPTLVEQQFGQL